MKQQTKCLCKKLFLIVTLIFTCLLTSCKKNKQVEPLIIWTNNAEIASYVELFNKTHKDTKAVVVYKESPAYSLSHIKNEKNPDVIIGPYLKNAKTRKQFAQIDYLFTDFDINKASFYKELLQYGVINDKQYLVPVSFNLPAVIFSKKNEKLINSDYSLNVMQIQNVCMNYNKQGKNDSFIQMGFAPSWDGDFLYLLTKMNNACYRENVNGFSYDKKNMALAVDNIKNWTYSTNISTTNETNFQFRYLYMPTASQVTSDKCIFAYITSDKLFTLSERQLTNLSFRWIENDGKIPIEDNLITMGMYKKAKHKVQAQKFISWFCQESTQKQLIERTESMKLDTVNFGICGGFSPIKSVNEEIYPTYYRQVLGFLPVDKYLTTPNILPYSWENLKDKVVIPYLKEITNTENTKEVQTLEERLSDLSKQYY